MEVPLKVTLRDGTRALIRPIHPWRSAAAEKGFARLSPQSRYLRFHSHIQRLTEAQVRYFTEVDHQDHQALAANDLDSGGEPGMGVARYVGLRDQPEVAEGSGLCSSRCSRAGRQQRHTSLPQLRPGREHPMLAIFEDLAAPREIDDAGVYKVDLELPPEPERLPDAPTGKVFDAEAQHWPLNLDIRLPPIWPPWQRDEEGCGRTSPSQPDGERAAPAAEGTRAPSRTG